MIPSVEITKTDGGTGVVRPSPVGILAIIAAAAAGTENVAITFTGEDTLKTTHGKAGHLSEFASYVMPVTRKPVMCVRGTPSTDAAYSAVTVTNPGTSAITAGTSDPHDTFEVVIQFSVGATVGQAGARYRYSLNGGATFSRSLALGTANSITIPDTGISVALGAGTLLATTRAAFTTTGPKLTNADLTAALEALRVTASPFECVLIDTEADADTVAACQAWLNTLQASGRFKVIILTARPRNAGETEDQYRTALEAIYASATGTDIVVCADAADVTSNLQKFAMPRPAGLLLAARAMAVRVGEDPAFVERGPLAGARITDARNNPKYHNEARFPGLDELRLATLRTHEEEAGVFFNNVPLLSPTGSDFVFIQHARCINRGCEIAAQALRRKLSAGFEKNPQVGENGERYIAEGAARAFEALANAEIDRQLVTPREVDDMALFISRTDDVRSNQGAVITGAIKSVSLGYVKKIQLTAGFVTALETEQ